LQQAQAQAEVTRREGFEAGRQTARTEVAALLESLILQAKALRDAYPEDVRKTAFQIAGSVLRARFQHEPELVRAFVAEALVKARHRTGLTIYLHPQDLPLVASELDALAKSLALGLTPRAVAADDVPRHGLRLESEAGAAWHVDLEDRLRELERRITRELARGKARR
jgi:flagellar biosynthesis/type III secretory pathway protein FliH